MVSDAGDAETIPIEANDIAQFGAWAATKISDRNFDREIAGTGKSTKIQFLADSRIGHQRLKAAIIPCDGFANGMKDFGEVSRLFIFEGHALCRMSKPNYISAILHG